MSDPSAAAENKSVSVFADLPDGVTESDIKRCLADLGLVNMAVAVSSERCEVWSGNNLPAPEDCPIAAHNEIDVALEPPSSQPW